MGEIVAFLKTNKVYIFMGLKLGVEQFKQGHSVKTSFKDISQDARSFFKLIRHSVML